MNAFSKVWMGRWGLACALNLRFFCAVAMLGLAWSSCAADPDFSGPDKPGANKSNPSQDALTLLSMAETNSAAVAATYSMKSVSKATNAAPDIYTNGMENLDDKYTLQIGDVINFQIKEDDDDPQPIQVTDSGDIEVPYIGRYPAAGKTCKELAGQLKEALEKKYYYRATVIISVKSMVSEGVIYVIGGVRSPGPQEIPRDDVLTVSKAILRAGGFDDFANQKEVRVTRKTAGGTNEVFTVNVEAVLKKGQIQDDPQVKPDDLIYVPEKTVRF